MAIGVTGAKYSIQPFKTKTPKWINWSEISNTLFYVSMKMHVHCTFCCSINLNKSLSKFQRNTVTILELRSRYISTTTTSKLLQTATSNCNDSMAGFLWEHKEKISSPIFPLFRSETRKGWDLWRNTTHLTRTYKIINSWLNNFKVFYTQYARGFPKLNHHFRRAQQQIMHRIYDAHTRCIEVR